MAAPVPAAGGGSRRRRPKLLGVGDPWDLNELTGEDTLVIDDVDADSTLYGSWKTDRIVAKLEAVQKSAPAVHAALKRCRAVWVLGSPNFQKPGNWQAWNEALCSFYGLGDPAGEPVPILWLRQRLETAEAAQNRAD